MVTIFILLIILVWWYWYLLERECNKDLTQYAEQRVKKYLDNKLKTSNEVEFIKEEDCLYFFQTKDWWRIWYNWWSWKIFSWPG